MSRKFGKSRAGISPMPPLSQRFQTPFNRNPQGQGGATAQIYHNSIRVNPGVGRLPMQRKGLR
jgi:hypothetical protein